MIELTKSSAARMDCLSSMIHLRRKNILNIENYLKQHGENLSPERVVQIEKDLADMRAQHGDRLSQYRRGTLHRQT